MGINLGLKRIHKLIHGAEREFFFPWKAIHVAGTNGKGSICTYISAMLNGAGIRCGRFTSPHLIDRWDGICIKDQPISKTMFLDAENDVLARSRKQDVTLTEFELLTATALRIFSREAVDVAIVEAGMGGAEDATNIIPTPECAVISKIGLDHQEYLGGTVEAIAAQKAGIIKQHGYALLDGSNDPTALRAVQAHAERVEAPLRIDHWQDRRGLFRGINGHKANLSLAFGAVERVLPMIRPDPNAQDFVPALKEINIPGRQQWISIESLTGRVERVLLDGAHNPQSADALNERVAEAVRQSGEPVTWLFAITHGKDPRNILSRLVREGDEVVTTQFPPVDGMPWIRPSKSEELVEVAASLRPPVSAIDGGESIIEALRKACEAAAGRPLVITGSLYLAGDVFRLLRQACTENSAGYESESR